MTTRPVMTTYLYLLSDSYTPRVHIIIIIVSAYRCIKRGLHVKLIRSFAAAADNLEERDENENNNNNNYKRIKRECISITVRYCTGSCRRNEQKAILYLPLGERNNSRHDSCCFTESRENGCILLFRNSRETRNIRVIMYARRFQLNNIIVIIIFRSGVTRVGRTVPTPGVQMRRSANLYSNNVFI